MLLQADWVLPISSPPIESGAVVVDGPVITAVGPAEELRRHYPGEMARDFPGCVLMPGLVNTHTHLKFSAFRDFAAPRSFSDWMLRLLVAARKLDERDYEVSCLWGAYECARCGVTSIADACREGWMVARAAAAAGLRARVYLEVFGLDDAKIPETMAGLEAGIERTRESAAPELSVGLGSDAGPRDDGRLDGGSSPMTHGPAVDVGVSPHAPYSVSARLYREVARFARREGLKLATHVAESREELDLLTRGKSPIPGAYRAANLWTGQRWKPPMQRPIQYVAGTCALGPDTLAVHAVQVNGDDITALTASGAAVAHCPRSNRHLNCGIAPVAEMIAAGVTVGLGTDSLASNDSLDMFAEMRAALTASRARAETSPGALSAPLTAEAVVRMATLEGARALGWDHLVGSLEPGKRADLIVARLSDRTPVGRQRDPDGLDVAEAVVSTITADDVRLTMVEGLEIAGDDFSLPPRDVASGLQAAQSKLGWRKSRD